MRASPVALAALLASGCGRSGYDAHDGAPPGDDGGGPGFDAGPIPPFDAALPDDCMTVTTTADEADDGESATPPHLGDGLSLREAILLANAIDGEDCITFDAAIDSLTIAEVLPAIDDPDGL